MMRLVGRVGMVVVELVVVVVVVVVVETAAVMVHGTTGTASQALAPKREEQAIAAERVDEQSGRAGHEGGVDGGGRARIGQVREWLGKGTENCVKHVHPTAMMSECRICVCGTIVSGTQTMKGQTLAST
eukprot:2971759-Pleurochrysis_carterae.AAC.2